MTLLERLYAYISGPLVAASLVQEEALHVLGNGASPAEIASVIERQIRVARECVRDVPDVTESVLDDLPLLVDALLRAGTKV